MLRSKTNRAVALAAAMLLLAGLAGCSGASQGSAKMDNLYERETNRLFNGNDQQRRSLPGVEDDDLAKDSHSLEAQGDNMAMNGDYEGALFVYNRAVVLADKKQRRRLLGKAGELTLRQGRFAETRGIMERLTRDDPTNAIAWQTLGLALLSMNEKDQAEKALSKAVAFNPNLWKAQNALGIIYNHGKQPFKALMSFNKAIQKGPALAELFNNRALAYLLVKNFDQAEADWKRALAIKADFKLAHNNLAILLAKRGDYRSAYSSFTKGSGQAEAHNNMGVMLAWKGQSSKAAKEFEQALKQLPRYYPKANSHLNQVSVSSGRLNGPMVVDLTEDGYLVPADYRTPGPATARTRHAAKAPASKVVASMKSAATKKKLSLAEPSNIRPRKPEAGTRISKPKTETAKRATEKKAESVAKREAGKVSEAAKAKPAPKKELDLSRFSAPGGSSKLLGENEKAGTSLLRAKPAQEPVAKPAPAVWVGGQDATAKPAYALASKVSTKDGRTVWRGDVRALFGNSD